MGFDAGRLLRIAFSHQKEQISLRWNILRGEGRRYRIRPLAKRPIIAVHSADLHNGVVIALSLRKRRALGPTITRECFDLPERGSFDQSRRMDLSIFLFLLWWPVFRSAWQSSYLPSGAFWPPFLRQAVPRMALCVVTNGSAAKPRRRLQGRKK